MIHVLDEIANHIIVSTLDFTDVAQKIGGSWGQSWRPDVIFVLKSMKKGCEIFNHSPSKT